MKKHTIISLFFAAAFAISAQAQTVIGTKNTTLVLDTKPGGDLGIAYYGAALDDVQSVFDAGFRSHRAYAPFGQHSAVDYTIAVTHPDGNKTLVLPIVDVKEEAWEGGKIVTVTTKDPVYPVVVKNFFKSYEQQDLIETWAEIGNDGKKPLTLGRYYSGSLPFRGGDVWISTLYGTWANEGRVNTEPLTRGYKVIKNTDGTRNSHTAHAEAMISLDGKPAENSGRVIGVALEWGGDYELRFKSNDDDYNMFYAGICDENSEYILEKGERFTTPALAYTYSAQGLSGVSRNFHNWGRKYRLAHGDKERKVLLNSWEGVYFDINEPGMDQMMGDIASMGGELFVMDDGWFGDKYPRLTDNSSLGDWIVDRNKLPHGIGWLVEHATQHGIKFGIWIEPEMTNNPSELYEAHPDWVLGTPNRPNDYGRGGTQLVLDMCNPAVQDFVVDVVDKIMTENPQIDYIKWDANMPVQSRHSKYLKHQGHLEVEYWRGFAKACDRIRAKYPDITIQCCASGGGRANWGVLPWFDEFWVSDNTDALQRVYMQWGTSYFFPAIAMASHISATPNHTVFRTTALKYRIDVAMSGRLGMEIQPKNMTEEEKALCRNAIAQYKEIRPVVQFGDIYRLVSPYDNKGIASMMYVSEEKDKAVFYWWKLENMYDSHFPRVCMAGLDPCKQYRVKELNRVDLQPLKFEGKVFDGLFLMQNGLEIPYTNEVEYHKKNDWSSRVLYLEEVK